MSLSFRPLHPDFGAEASGLDLTQPLTPAQVQAVDEGMNTHGILLFRGQPLTPDQQMAFTMQFGPLDLGFKRVRNVPGQRPAHRFAYDEIADISNVEADGSVARRESRKIVGNIANQLWHADSSFQRPRAKYSMLHAVVLPSWGGNTEYVDLRNAWDRLEPAMQARLRPLVAEHFALHSRFLLGDTDYTPEQIAAIPPAKWPLVQRHSGSGREHLYIGAHARAIDGMTVAEARMLLADLLEHATHPDHVYRHTWQVGDLLIWDNRCTLHRGRAYDLAERRELRRTTTMDVESEHRFLPEEALQAA
jgi:alpha-ketoglutarate-dependent 2,4-dichlorophenoxyacetate dioxygenase